MTGNIYKRVVCHVLTGCLPISLGYDQLVSARFRPIYVTHWDYGA